MLSVTKSDLVEMYSLLDPEGLGYVTFDQWELALEAASGDEVLKSLGIREGEAIDMIQTAA
jgi:hypothetical protein